MQGELGQGSEDLLSDSVTQSGTYTQHSTRKCCNKQSVALGLSEELVSHSSKTEPVGGRTLRTKLLTVVTSCDDVTGSDRTSLHPREGVLKDIDWNRKVECAAPDLAIAF